MSLINQLFAQGERVFLVCGHGDVFTVLSGTATGRTFIGRIDSQPVIDPDSDLGPDPRMQDVVRILPPILPLQVGDMVSAIGKKFKLLKREDNAATVTVDFWIEQQI